MNEKMGVGAEDRLMTPREQVTMPIEMEEAAIMRAIEISKKIGLPASALSGKLQELEVNRRILIWLASFTNAEEKAEAIERITLEGLPPEVFKDDENFIIEGTNTIN